MIETAQEKEKTSQEQRAEMAFRIMDRYKDL